MLIGTSLYLFLSIATTLWAVHYGGYIPERQVMESNQHHLSQCDRLKKHLIKKPQLYKKKKGPFHYPGIGPHNQDFAYLYHFKSLHFLLCTTGFRSLQVPAIS